MPLVSIQQKVLLNIGSCKKLLSSRPLALQIKPAGLYGSPEACDMVEVCTCGRSPALCPSDRSAGGWLVELYTFGFVGSRRGGGHWTRGCCQVYTGVRRRFHVCSQVRS